MGIGYLILLAFGGYGALQFYKNQKVKENAITNRRIAQPGISYYQPIAVPSRSDKVYAFDPIMPPGATYPAVYAAPLGPDENQGNGTDMFMP